MNIDEYLEAKHYSENSIRSKKIVLKKLEKFFKQRGVCEVSDLNSDLIREVMSEVTAKCSDNTKGYYCSYFNLYLKWELDRGSLLCNPMPNLKYKKVYRLKKIPGQLKVKESLEKKIISRNPLRDRAIVELLYSTGIRRGELVSIKLMDYAEGELKVKGKGSKERVVPVGKVARKWISRYINEERDQEGEYLFLGKTPSEKLGKQTIRLVCKKYGYYPHMLRHCCALHMLENGAGILSISKLLGHSSVATTEIYTQYDCSLLQKAIDRFHPLEHKK